MFEYVTEDTRLSTGGSTLLVIFIVLVILIGVSSTFIFHLLDKAGKEMIELQKQSARKLARDVATGSIGAAMGSMRVSTGDSEAHAEDTQEQMNKLNVVSADPRPSAIPFVGCFFSFAIRYASFPHLQVSCSHPAGLGRFSTAVTSAGLVTRAWPGLGANPRSFPLPGARPLFRNVKMNNHVREISGRGDSAPGGQRLVGLLGAVREKRVWVGEDETEQSDRETT